MTNIYEAKTNEELHTAVVDLCVQAIHLWKISTNSVTAENAAERTVPPVPRAWREVPSAVASGLTFRCINGVVQAKHDSIHHWIDSISVTMPDVDIIADLKANPYVTVKSACDCDTHMRQVCDVCQDVSDGMDAPDKDCVTLADGSCVSEKHCMHGPPMSITREQAVNALLYMGAELFRGEHTIDGRDRLRLPEKNI